MPGRRLDAGQTVHCLVIRKVCICQVRLGDSANYCVPPFTIKVSVPRKGQVTLA